MLDPTPHTEEPVQIQNESELLELPPMGRGRPSAVMLAERARLQKVIEANRKRLASQSAAVSDNEILDEIQYRFDALSRYSIAAAMGEVRCLVAHGSGGIGKTFELIKTLDDIIPGEYEVIEGGDISPVHLFMAAYRNREAGRVLIFDDADTVITSSNADSEAKLNLVKKMTDTTAVRRMTYMKASPVLEADGVPNEFVFEGSVVFLSNLDFERLAQGNDKRSAHIQAIMTRSLVLDLKIHEMRSKYLWVRKKAVEAILPAANATEEESTKVLEFIDKNYDRFKALSLRSVGYLITMIRSTPEMWTRDATMMLLR